MKKQITKSNCVKILKTKTLYRGYSELQQLTLQHKTTRNGGALSPIYLRELIKRMPAAAVLPYDSKRDQVVLIEQLRVGALATKNPWLLEVVAGVQDKKESLRSLIRRELWEEAGLTARKLLPIASYWSTPGISSERVHLFCALVDASKAPEYAGLAHEHEDIRVHVMSFQKAWQLLAAGRLDNATTIIALQWLKLNHLNLTRASIHAVCKTCG